MLPEGRGKALLLVERLRFFASQRVPELLTILDKLVPSEPT